MTTTAPVSKTAAIAAAAKCVSIWGRGTSWTVCGPYRVEVPRGPCTEHNCDSHSKALRVAAAWKAQVALQLMGRLTDDASYAIERAADGSFDRVGNTRALVDIGLKTA